MSEWSPASMSREWILVVALICVGLFLYSLLIAGQALLGILPAVLFGAVYVTWRFLVAVEAIADALQRIASEYERE
ncbi:hypothetical protein GRX03_04050 [Halovenus sp. WSH3]|uniref:Uncharacterized protein n=1 Tax=Halovenus carboxidivorans TaxID=2692199 RepID=A0A6B0SYD6_9EURY|nr:hypothetical protein [Halovenus carboxidivorans]MXR50778.1 hypothetical protein [Halovenus carboxidivorans]